ncbi:MAG: HEAT repeat domain-containing protein [Planctomycetota bacterium]
MPSGERPASDVESEDGDAQRGVGVGSVRQPDVPAGYVPPPAHDPRVADLVDKRLRSVERLLPSFDGRRHTADERDWPSLRTVLRDTDDDDTVRNEAASLLRASGDPELDAVLVEVLKDEAEAERFRSFAVQHLTDALRMSSEASVAGETLRAHFQRLLEDRHLKVRRQALLGLARIDDPAADRMIVDVLSREEPGPMADLAMRLVQEKRMNDQYVHLRRLAYAEDPEVRVAAIAALGALGDETSRGAFVAAASSKHARLKAAGVDALSRIDGMGTEDGAKE